MQNAALWRTWTETRADNLGRGRIIPTLPRGAMWYATAQWMDVNASKMAEVMLNHGNVQVGTSLLTRVQAFVN